MEDLNQQLNTPELPPHHGWPKVLTYILAGLVFVGAVAATYWFQYGQYENDASDQVCTQVIQRARNPQTGEERDFPTPCDVPAGWEKINEIEPSSEVLLQIDSDGGLCVYGACTARIVLNTDGTYRKETGGKLESEGRLTPAQIEELEAKVDGTDFVSIKANKFTGTCPIAYDGMRNIFTFYTSRGVETLSDCDITINYETGVFADLVEYFNLFQANN